MAFGDGQGRSGIQASAIDKITVGTSSTVIVSSANANKSESIILSNIGTATVYVSVGIAAETEKGVAIPAGFSVAFTGSDCPRSAVYGVSTENCKVSVFLGS